MADEKDTPRAERPHIRVSEDAPAWQQALDGSSALEHLCSLTDPPLTPRYRSDAVEIPDATGGLAKRLFELIFHVCAAHGYPVARENLSGGPGLRVRVG